MRPHPHPDAVPAPASAPAPVHAHVTDGVKAPDLIRLAPHTVLALFETLNVYAALVELLYLM
jgi:cysteine synthase A